MKLKVLYEMDWTSVALCLDCHLDCWFGVQGVVGPLLNFGLDLILA